MLKERVDISVVVPAYNEQDNIAVCLTALDASTVEPLEVIVADGGSRDETSCIARSCGAIVVDNPARTAAAGRNSGILAAKGSVIAFTDADCIPDSGWLEVLWEAFCESNADIVAGKVVPCAPRNLCEDFWNHLAWEVLMEFGDEPKALRSRDLRHSAVTASCAYRADALNKLGGFDLWFGNNAEDVDLMWRALALGLDIRYVPEAVVVARGVTSLKGIKKKSFRNGVSSSKLQKHYGGIINFDRNIYRQLFSNLAGKSASNYPSLERTELIWHLLGKYAGSIRHLVINV